MKSRLSLSTLAAIDIKFFLLYASFFLLFQREQRSTKINSPLIHIYLLLRFDLCKTIWNIFISFETYTSYISIVSYPTKYRCQLTTKKPLAENFGKALEFYKQCSFTLLFFISFHHKLLSFSIFPLALTPREKITLTANIRKEAGSVDEISPALLRSENHRNKYNGTPPPTLKKKKRREDLV